MAGYGKPMGDTPSLTWTRVGGRWFRWPIRPDRSGGGWRIEHAWTPTGWRDVGREPIADVEFAVAAIEAYPNSTVGPVWDLTPVDSHRVPTLSL